MRNQSSAPDHPALTFFDGMPAPVCLVDDSGRLLALNRRALTFWDMEPADVCGQPALPALGIVPTDGQGADWSRFASPPGIHHVACRVAAPAQTRQLSILYVPLSGTTPPLAALFVIEGWGEVLLPRSPEAGLRDPVSGLGNRHLWVRAQAAWAPRPGCALLFELDDLKEVEDLYGAQARERVIAATGQALAAGVPVGALAVRYAGDAFAVLLPNPDAVAAEAAAERIAGAVAGAVVSPELPVVPRLRYGAAAFAPGGVETALQRAGASLYERRGVVLPAASGGRIILTRAGRNALRRPGDDGAQRRPAAAVERFGTEFEEYFRAGYARAAEQAREFVGFVAPEPGSAVIEVGAGPGRITFDGGLAERIGSEGQLLVTDPAPDQIAVARAHAAQRGLDWVRFVQATAEKLPVASGTADLCLGALFLHFAEPDQALRGMGRVVRPGGRVAVSAFRAFDWPDAWLEALAPIRRELAEAALPFRHFLLAPGELEYLMMSAGLRVERMVEIGPDLWEFPSGDLAVAIWTQLGLVRLLLRGVPAERHAAAEEEFNRNLREMFPRHPRQAWTIAGLADYAVARKPG